MDGKPCLSSSNLFRVNRRLPIDIGILLTATAVSLLGGSPAGAQSVISGFSGTAARWGIPLAGSWVGEGLFLFILLLAAGGLGWAASRAGGRSTGRRVSLLQQALNACASGKDPARRISLPGRKDGLAEVSETVNRLLEQREKNLDSLKSLENDYQKLFSSGVSANVWISPEGEILRCNQAFAALTGYTAVRDLAGLPFYRLHPDPNAWRLMLIELQTRKKVDLDAWSLRDRNGNSVMLQGRWVAAEDEKGGARQILGTFTDRSRLQQLEQDLATHYQRDPLTGLKNRVAFELEMGEFDSGQFDPVGIFIVDVNGLKFVNDNLSYEEANRLLRVAGEILQEAFPGVETIARVGGDEFAVLLGPADRQVFEKARSQIRQAVEQHNAEHPELPLSLAVGFALNDDTPCSVREVFTQADNNMHREKLLCNQSIHSSVVQTLNKALEVRDFITEGHARRLQDLVERMSKALGLPERSVIDMRLLAQFHDIGKVGIPDRLLMKPGPLTPEEAIEMQKHCEIGYRIALSAMDLVPIADWILKHHEWWNGQGYPGGLKGERIPLECRILSLADAYDVLTHDRPYRQAVSHEEAVDEIKQYAAVQFDPFLVKKFCELFSESEIPLTPTVALRQAI